MATMTGGTSKVVIPSPPKIPPPKPPSSPKVSLLASFKKAASAVYPTQEVPLNLKSANVSSNNSNNNNVSNNNNKGSPLRENVKATASSNKDRKPLQIEDFVLGKTLGTGSFGRVRFAKIKSSSAIGGSVSEMQNARLAIKILKKKKVVKTNQAEHIINEKQVLEIASKMKRKTTKNEDEDDYFWFPHESYGAGHPFLVKLFATFQDERTLYMVMEFVRGGEFFTHLRNRGHLKNEEAKFFAASILSVFSHLHETCDVIYRDLKPENMLLDQNGYMRLTDFGFAKQIPDNRTYTLCGTPEYIAPEILLNQGFGKSVDWWAMGVLIYEMLSGRAPFQHDDPMEIYKMVLKGEVRYPSYFDVEARSLLRKLLQAEPSNRYGCMANGSRDIATHSWFDDFDWEGLLSQTFENPPIRPRTSGEDDTSNFDEYPDSDEEERNDATTESESYGDLFKGF